MKPKVALRFPHFLELGFCVCCHGDAGSSLETKGSTVSSEFNFEIVFAFLLPLLLLSFLVRSPVSAC